MHGHSQRTVLLTPPTLSSDSIKEEITCIRAHRERLFNVSTELQGDKLIAHNYGHGGAGWTFLFGCVHQSIRQFQALTDQHSSFKNKPIAVIGAGCHGLLTAITLARAGHTVRIIARETQNIPSYKAAGFFFPRPRKMSQPPERAIFELLGMESYTQYMQIVHGTHPFIQSGARLVPAYYDPAIDPGFGPYIAQGVMHAPERISIDFGNGKTYPAMEYTVTHINAATMMEQLHAAIVQCGIPITQQEIDSFEELPEPIIFNCAGMGAKKLTDDKRIIPIQGHLITLKNQPVQLNYMINMRVLQNTPQGTPRDELLYFAPKDEGILGITFIRGQDSLTANAHEFDRLMERSRKFFGS